MQKQVFFKKLWRFNAIIIALAGVAGLVMLLIALAFISIDFYNQATRDVHKTNMVNTSQTEEIEQKIQYGHPAYIHGTDYIQVPLISSQSYHYRYNSIKSKAIEANRNILFYNTKTNAYRWLFTHNNYLVQSEHINGYDALNSSKEKTIIAQVYQVVKADTNHDDRLTYNDNITYAISKADGSQYVELLSNIDSVITTHINVDGDFVVIYKKSNKVYVATINLDSLQLMHNSALPNIQNNQN